MIDIVLVSTPIATPNGVPPAGIFSLRSSLEKNGFTVVCIDGNKFNSTIEIQIEIDKYEFKWLGISILTDRQIKQGLEIGAEYDNVIYGGPPVNWRWDDPDFIPKGHHYIKGEGEVAIVEFLKGNLKYPGIDGTDPIEIKDLNNLPPPDYSGHNYNTLILTGSRGCVRRCNFCNVYEIWKTFRYVDGEVLAKQMIEIVGSNKKKQIFFSDSLINGSDKHFKKMCNYLIENNHKIPWRAQFIIRKKPQDYFDMVAKAGAVSLHIGIESVSEKIRYDMNKRITDIDMYDNIDGLLKAGIPKLVLMFIVGYHTETEDDFNQTLYFMNRYKDHSNKILLSPSLMSFISGTPIQRETEYNLYWFTHKDSTLPIRIKRYLKFLYWSEYFKYLSDAVLDVRINQAKELVSENEWNDLYQQSITEAKHQLSVI